MQDYIEFAKKNGVILEALGSCQFCGAKTEKGVHECLEIFNWGFQNVNYSVEENHIFRFLIVDAHTLQHSEIHGRWNNHFHLTRLHLILKYDIKWTYQLSPKLSTQLKLYKKNKQDEYLQPPEVFKRGSITTKDILDIEEDEFNCKLLIKQWAREVYETWSRYHKIVDLIAIDFLNKNKIPII